MTAAYEHGGQYPGNGAAPAGPPTETEVGNIIIEAQRFADETALEARRAAEAIVAQAQAEADRIVQEARHQAVATATITGPTIPADAVTHLAATIDGFARTNTALIEELALLRQSLATQASPVSPPSAPVPVAPVPVAPVAPVAPVPAPAPAATRPAPAPTAGPIVPPGRVPVTQGIHVPAQGQARPVTPAPVQRSA